jgi:hypothetical protein
MSEVPQLLSPPALEVLKLVAAFLEQDLLPVQTDPKLRFRVRIAADLLKSASRELAGFDLPVILREGMPALLEDLRSDRRSLSDESVYEAALQLVGAKLAIVLGGDRNATS